MLISRNAYFCMHLIYINCKRPYIFCSTLQQENEISFIFCKCTKSLYEFVRQNAYPGCCLDLCHSVKLAKSISISLNGTLLRMGAFSRLCPVDDILLIKMLQKRNCRLAQLCYCTDHTILKLAINKNAQNSLLALSRIPLHKTRA